MTRSIPTKAVEISDIPGLDPIIVFWWDVGPSQGYVTITCYGSAWTAYFRAMGGRTIREFFADADHGYLVSRLGITQFLKQTKQHHSHLSKIISAVKKAIAEEAERVMATAPQPCLHRYNRHTACCWLPKGHQGPHKPGYSDGTTKEEEEQNG